MGTSKQQLIAWVLWGSLSSALTAHGQDETQPPHTPRARAVESLPAGVLDRPEENRPDVQLIIDVFGRPLKIGGELELRTRFRGDHRLDSDLEDDEGRAKSKVEVELLYAVSEQILVYIEGKHFVRSKFYREDERRETKGFAERGEMWIRFGELFDTPLSVQIGRQRFSEAREWMWDTDLDAIRVAWGTPGLHAELGVGRRLTRISTRESHIAAEQRDVDMWLGRVDYEWWRDQHVELFYFNKRDGTDLDRPGDFVDRDTEDESDVDATWFGARLRGQVEHRLTGRVAYWGDGATVRGKEFFTDFDTVPAGRITGGVFENDIRGWGADVGVSWSPRLIGAPTLTATFAMGSGDRRQDEKHDTGFRQTGLQDNNVRFSGANRFRTYGELLRPELSNLRVTTIALGFPILRSSSLEFIYHAYQQVHAADHLRGDELSREPDGSSRRIGKAFDATLGLEEWEHLEIEVVGSIFQAGSAFGDAAGDRAYFGELKLKYNF